MKFNFALYLAILTSSFLITRSQPSYATVTTELFASPPVKVFDASNTTDFRATQKRTTLDTFSAGITNDTIHFWAIFWDGNYVKGVNRRTLNATVLASGNDTSEASVIEDTWITTSIWTSSTPLFASCPGFFAIAASSPATTSLFIFSSTNLHPTKIPLMLTQNSSEIGSLWFQGGYFYLAWWYNHRIYLQGVSTNGNLRYTSTVTVVTTPYRFSINPDYFIAGSSSCSEANNIYVLYKAFPTLYTVQINKSTGAVGTPQALATDFNPWTSHEEYTYWAAGFIGSCVTNGIAIINCTTTWHRDYNFIIFYNDTFTNGTDLKITPPTEDYYLSDIMSINYPGGYVVFATYEGWFCGIPQHCRGYMYQPFSLNGTAISNQTFLAAIYGPVSIFVDSNSAIWFGYTSNFSSSFTQIGMIGKLFSIDQGSITSSQTENTTNVGTDFSQVKDIKSASFLEFIGASVLEFIVAISAPVKWLFHKILFELLLH